MEEAKKQAVTRLPVFTAGAAFLFFWAALVAFWNGPINYREQVKQLGWTVTNATVSYVYEYYDAFHFKGSGSGATVYDTHYEYVVDSQTYTGVIEGEITHKNLGDTFLIKFNPEAPEEHTLTLEPSKTYIESGLIWGALCLTMVIITVVIIKKGQSFSKNSYGRNI